MSAGGAAAAAAAMIQAVRAAGVIVYVEGMEFLEVLKRVEAPLVVHAQIGWFTIQQQYLTSYKGIAFYTRTTSLLTLPPGVELVRARSIWVPG